MLEQVLTPDRPIQTSMKSTAPPWKPPPAIPCLTPGNNGVCSGLATAATSDVPAWWTHRLAATRVDYSLPPRSGVYPHCGCYELWQDLTEECCHSSWKRGEGSRQHCQFSTVDASASADEPTQVACGQCEGPHRATECPDNVDAAWEVLAPAGFQKTATPKPVCSARLPQERWQRRNKAKPKPKAKKVIRFRDPSPSSISSSDSLGRRKESEKAYGDLASLNIWAPKSTQSIVEQCQSSMSRASAMSTRSSPWPSTLSTVESLPIKRER